MIVVTTTQLLVGALLAAAISTFSSLVGMLSFSGAIAAFLVGFVTFGFGGVAFAAPLLAFFLTSSLLSKWGRRRKALLEANYEKGSRRDAWQVLANGGALSLLALAYVYGGEPRLCLTLFLAAIASANADTWATEIGGAFGKQPRLVTTLRPAEPGVSGAISIAGLVAAALGSALIGFVGWLVWPHDLRTLVTNRGLADVALVRIDAAEITAVIWAGFIAAYLDSILGASIQIQFTCESCSRLSERRTCCGKPTTRKRGWRWVNNDVVNLLSGVFAVAFAWLLLSVYNWMMVRAN